jgi:hypothetical protein
VSPACPATSSIPARRQPRRTPLSVRSSSPRNSSRLQRSSSCPLPPALGDRLIDQRLPAPPECAHIQLNGKERASVVERALPGFGVRARYIVCTYPVGDQTFIERMLQFRTDQYVVLIRVNAVDNPEPAFLTFAAKARDGLNKLKPTG